jgi:DnaJ homolog subfamily C member 9
MAPSSEDLFDEEPPSINPYEVLGIEKLATADEIKSAYRRAALKNHPGMRSIEY